jgi:NADH:ubiquinone oxidoreductase subunit
MQIIDRILIKLFSKEVGQDDVGNRYFESYSQDYLGRKKRLVIYRGVEEASKINPSWYSWMHFLTNDIPFKSDEYLWQKHRIPNLTGTEQSKTPNKNWIKNISYTKWQPK